MVEPRLTPQSFRRTSGSSLNTLQGATLPSVRSVQGARDTGTEAEVNFFINAASDSGRLQQLSAGAFDEQMRVTKTLQSLEKDKIVAEAQLTIQEGLTHLQTEITDASQYPQKSAELVDKVSEQYMQREGLSRYQRELMKEDFANAKIRAAKSAFEYKTELDKAESQFAIEEILQRKQTLVLRNPNVADDVIEESIGIIDSYGEVLTELERVQLKQKMKETLNQTRVYGEISADPYAAQARLKGGVYDDVLDAKTLMQMEGHVDAEIKSREARFAKQQREIRDQQLNETMLNISLQALGAQDEEGNPVSISVTDIVNNPTFSTGQKSKLVEFLRRAGEDAGNARTASDLARRIERGEVTRDDILDSADPNTSFGNPISASETRTLLEQFDNPLPAEAKLFYERVNEQVDKLSSIDRLGLYAPEIRQRVTQAIRQEVRKIKESGADVDAAFRINSGQYIGDDILRNYIPTQTEFIREMNKRVSQNLQRDTQKPQQQEPNKPRSFEDLL